MFLGREDTLEDAIVSAHEAISCHIEGLMMDGEPIPEQAPIETHRAREAGNPTWALVSVDVSRLSSAIRRVNISMPARVLAIVDEAAAREGESRSGLLARAALSYIHQGSVAVQRDESENRIGAGVNPVSKRPHLGFSASQDLSAGACGWSGARSRTLLKFARVFRTFPNV